MTAPNPTLETLADVSTVLGFQVELVPMDRQTRRKVTDQLTQSGSEQSTLAVRRNGQRPLRQLHDALRQRPRVTREVLLAQGQSTFVDDVGELRPERLRGAPEHHKERAPACKPVSSLQNKR